MASFNKVVIMGNVTKKPELRVIGETSVCNMSIAINKKWKSKSGESKESVTFVEVSAWGATATNCVKFLDKGSPVLIDGELQQQEWNDKETGKKRSKLSVRANIVQFLGSKPKATESHEESEENQEEVPF